MTLSADGSAPCRPERPRVTRTKTMSAASETAHIVLYKIPEVMTILRMSRGAVYSEINAGRLRRVKRGRSVFVTSTAIADYIQLLEREAAAALA
jgi:predicted DNA-binding transcriptional regulator AlpA